jgi:hypothetical protein
MELRKPLFIAALVLLGLCALVELGASLFLPRPQARPEDIAASIQSKGAGDDRSSGAGRLPRA